MEGGFASGVVFCVLSASSLSAMPCLFCWKLFKEVLKIYQRFPHLNRRNGNSVQDKVSVDTK